MKRYNFRPANDGFIYPLISTPTAVTRRRQAVQLGMMPTTLVRLLGFTQQHPSRVPLGRADGMWSETTEIWQGSSDSAVHVFRV